MEHYDQNNRCNEWVLSRKEPCGGPGHFIGSNGDVACGRHKKVLLDPMRLKVNEAEIERQAKADRRKGMTGDVILGRIVNYYNIVDYTSGYLAVYPNHSRPPAGSEGLWLPSLSPKVIGPIDTPDGPALSIEIAHQAGRVYAHEADAAGNPLPEFYERKAKSLMDPERAKWRHVFAPTKPESLAYLKRIGATTEVLFNVIGGKRYDYVAARQFYCGYFDAALPELPEYAQLLDLLSQGVNLQLFGYDAIPELTPENAYRLYCDKRYRFGHESVIYCCLVMEPEDRPWRRWKRDNPNYEFGVVADWFDTN